MSGSDNLNQDQFEDYRMSHRPTAVAGFHEAHEAYPNVYEHPEYYTSRRDPWHRETHQAMLQARGNPNHMTTVYRALPTGAKGAIQEGDWITPSKSYAQTHADGQSEAQGKPFQVVSKKVPAHHIGIPGDYPPEAGYFPKGVEHEDAYKEYRS